MMDDEKWFWGVTTLAVVVFVAVVAYQIGRNVMRTEATQRGYGGYVVPDPAREDTEWRWVEPAKEPSR